MNETQGSKIIGSIPVLSLHFLSKHKLYGGFANQGNTSIFSYATLTLTFICLNEFCGDNLHQLHFCQIKFKTDITNISPFYSFRLAGPLNYFQPSSLDLQAQQVPPLLSPQPPVEPYP